MPEESKADKTPPEPAIFLDGDISRLGEVSIQIHEMYIQLKKSGFTSSEALELSGMVLVAFSTPRYEFIDDFEYNDEEGGNLLEFSEEEEEEEDPEGQL
jgi:hypothetical protein